VKTFCNLDAIFNTYCLLLSHGLLLEESGGGLMGAWGLACIKKILVFLDLKGKSCCSCF
jgi:hypothetical protein